MMKKRKLQKHYWQIGRMFANIEEKRKNVLSPGIYRKISEGGNHEGCYCIRFFGIPFKGGG